MKEKAALAAVALAAAALCLFGWYYTHVYHKMYLFFEGEYYAPIGGFVPEDAVGKPLGEVKRNSLRTFWNRSGDSNRIPVGSVIYERADMPGDEELLVGLLFLNQDDEEITKYFVMKKES